ARQRKDLASAQQTAFADFEAEGPERVNFRFRALTHSPAALEVAASPWNVAQAGCAPRRGRRAPDGVWLRWRLEMAARRGTARRAAPSSGIAWGCRRLLRRLWVR